MKGTICLLGPKHSGKSSLMRTMRQCIELGSHGYPPADMASFRLKEITSSEFVSGRLETDETILTRFPKGSFADEEADFLNREVTFDSSGVEQTSRPDDGPTYHHFSLHLSLRVDGTGSVSSEPYLFRLMDAAGELSTPSGPTEEDWERHRDALDSALRDASGIILVAPPADGRQERWATFVLDALEKLARRPTRKLSSVVVVFSQYDRLFVRCGAEAASVAVRWHAVRYTVQREFKSRPWLQRLVDILPDENERGDGSAVRLRFTVASAFGFAKVFGNPNFDPNVGVRRTTPAADDPPVLFRFRIPRGAQLDATQLWRPFLSADPFIFAATGIDGYYMLGREEVGGVAASNDNARARPDTGGSGSPAGADLSRPLPWYRQFINFFDASDDS